MIQKPPIDELAENIKAALGEVREEVQKEANSTLIQEKLENISDIVNELIDLKFTDKSKEMKGLLKQTFSPAQFEKILEETVNCLNIFPEDLFTQIDKISKSVDTPKEKDASTVIENFLKMI